MGTIPAPNIAELGGQIAAAPMNQAAEYARVAALNQQTQQAQALAPGQQQLQSQQIQAQQRQFADQDALTKAMTQFDPQKNSLADIPKLITSNGGSGQAALQAQSGLITQRQNLAKLSDDQFGQEQRKNDLIQGVHDQVTQAAPEQKQDVYSRGLQSLAQAGVDVSKEPQQYPGDDAFAQHLPAIRLHSAILDEANKDRDTTAKELTAQAAIMKDRYKDVNGALYDVSGDQPKIITPQGSDPAAYMHLVDQVVPPTSANGALNARTKAAVQFYMQQGNAKAAQDEIKQAGQQVGSVEKDVAIATNPQIQAGKVEVARNTAAARNQAQAGQFGQAGDPMIDMVGTNRIDLATALQRVPPAQKDLFLRNLAQAYPEFNQGTFGVAKKEQTAFTSGSQGQQLTAIGTARNHMQTFKDTADALDNGNFLKANQVGNYLGMQFGSDKATNFNIARSAFAGEVGKAFAGANVGVQDRQELIDKINAASSPAQLKGYADTADALLAGKQKSLKESYQQGIKGQPNFGGGNQPAQHVAGGKAQGLTEGQTGTGSDGKKYVVKNGVWTPQ